MAVGVSSRAALRDWLATVVPTLTPPVEVRRVGAGQSNVTSLVRDAAGGAWILRCPPPGTRDRTAHDVHREARVLRALAGSAVPVPEVLATGCDEAGIDGPFYLMAHAPGVVLAKERDAAALSAGERTALSRDVVDVLAALHTIRPPEVDLADLGRPEGYLERQIARTAGSWARWGADSAAAPVWEACHRRLGGGVPRQQRTVIAHGDYRLSNLMIADGRITAVLDWELCTLGDPLADLAWLADDWRSPHDPAVVMPSPTRMGGFTDRETLVAEYAAATGLDVSDLGYYRAFTHWKAATLLQGVLLRRRSGGLGEHGALDLDELTRTITFLLDEALDLG